MDPKMLNGHDRELFWACKVGHTKAGPHDDVLVGDGRVLVDPASKTELVIPTWVLIDVNTRRIKLVLGIGRHEHLARLSEIRQQNSRVIDSFDQSVSFRILTLCLAQGARFQTIEPSWQSNGGI